MKKKDQVTAAEAQKEAVQVKGKKRRAREAQRDYVAFVSGDSLGELVHCSPYQRDAHGAGGP